MIIIILAAIAAFILLPLLPVFREKPKEISYKIFQEYVKENKVKYIEISLAEKDFKFTLKGDDDKKDKGSTAKYITQNPKYDNFKKDLLEAGIEVREQKDKSNYTSYIFSVMSIGLMVVFLVTFRRQMHGEDSTRKKKNRTSSVRFSDIAGLDEIKQDLQTIIEFLKKPQKYKEAGAKLPKGIMLYGPPGTGKTMLAKAIAGEADVEFLAATGSEFDERYVGVGAQRIRRLFSDAKKKAPCIIFIDEIDALGGKRTSADSSSDRQSVNQLLGEMDGFSTDDDIIVIAATNRPEDLDSALIRPGRFDSHFSVPLPANAADRRKIIDIYTKNKKLDDSVDLELLSKETLGYSPADIEAILNEAAILAVNNNDGIITKEYLDDAFFKQLTKGHKKKDMERKQEDLKKTAWHEAGHALLGILLHQDMTKVTIIPSTSGAGGITLFNKEKIGMYSKTELENQIKVLYAGRCAESILCGEDEITTGASNDITEASKILLRIIAKYGMSEYVLIDMDEIEVDKQFLLKTASDLSKKLYHETYSTLENHKNQLMLVAEELMDKETLTGEEIRRITEGNFPLEIENEVLGNE